MLLAMLLGASVFVQLPVTRFTVCSTESCPDQDKFEVVARSDHPDGQEMIRKGMEMLAARKAYPGWVPRTPIICHNPQNGCGPFANSSFPVSTVRELLCCYFACQCI